VLMFESLFLVEVVGVALNMGTDYGYRLNG